MLGEARPLRTANAIASERLCTPSLCITLLMWVRTVCGLTDRRSAISEPVKATEAFARAAVAHGARLQSRCAVQALLTRNGEISGVVTEQGEWRTTRVVCAAGAWSAPLLRTAGLSLPQRLVRASLGVARTSA